MKKEHPYGLDVRTGPILGTVMQEKDFFPAPGPYDWMLEWAFDFLEQANNIKAREAKKVLDLELRTKN